jgi:hypothetical protein
MSDRERQVRECAYYLWEAEGRPHGRAEMHWLMAEIAILLQSYLNASSGCLQNAQLDPTACTAKTEPESAAAAGSEQSLK